MEHAAMLEFNLIPKRLFGNASLRNAVSLKQCLLHVHLRMRLI